MFDTLLSFGKAIEVVQAPRSLLWNMKWRTRSGLWLYYRFSIITAVRHRTSSQTPGRTFKSSRQSVCSLFKTDRLHWFLWPMFIDKWFGFVIWIDFHMRFLLSAHRATSLQLPWLYSHEGSIFTTLQSHITFLPLSFRRSFVTENNRNFQHHRFMM